tara:strand:+ start:337 stop:807 length:471 start_codon:yes stop_codon:yes gene_type:complete
MDISEIAQIVTGIATLMVAVVLVLQLRKQNQQLDIQNKDHDREKHYRNMEAHLGRISSIFTNKEFRKIFIKRNYERKDLSDEEYLALSYYFRTSMATLNTSFDSENINNRGGVEFILRMTFETKIGRFWFKDEFESMTFINPKLKEIANNVYLEYK